MCETIFEFGPAVQEEMVLKDFSIFSSGSHFVQLSKFGRGHCDQHLSDFFFKISARCSLKVFLFLSAVAISFDEAKPF